MLVGPGENAGVVDVGDGIAAAIRIESHNHPSAIEPYQGAATGVGGILRDIFTMGARPIALDGPAALRSARRRPQPLDRRRRGRRASPATATPSACPPSAARSSSTRPTRTTRWSTCFCLGVLPRRAAGARPGHRASATWPCCSARPPAATASAACRVLASAGFGDDEADAAKRPSVQVGDPFEEKRLIEACLDAARRRPRRRHPGPRRRRPHLRHQRDRQPGRRRAWTSTSRPVPLREPGMEPFEVMTSARARSGCWPSSSPATSTRCSPSARGGRSRAAVVGTRHRRRPRCASSTGSTARCSADVPAASLARGRPAVRPAAAPSPPTAPSALADRGRRSPPPADAGADLLELLADTVVGVAPVRPPAVPQHRRGARRRRHRAAPQAPGHRRRHRPGAGPHHRRQPPLVRASTPRPGTALVVAEAVAEPGLRRRPAAGARQLPQLRQPRAPRGDVAAVRGDRRHGRGLPGLRHAGRRRQRQPLQREPAAATSTPRRSSACSAWSTALDRRPPGRRLGRRADGCWCSAPRRRSAWPGRGGRGSAGRKGGALAGARPGGASRPLAALVRDARRRRAAAGVHDVADGGLALALAEMVAASEVGLPS